MHQAQTYWDAGDATRGSAAALPYYYGALQLAKAELLISNPAEIQAGSIMHGLRKLRSNTTSIRSDQLEVTCGVFPLLYERRMGQSIPLGTRLSAINLLSLIPEIGLEMQDLRSSRPPALPAYYVAATSETEAWSLVLAPGDLATDKREPVYRKFLASFEEVAMTEVPNWRQIFALSSRVFGGTFHLYQSKQTFSLIDPGGQTKPDFYKAVRFLEEVLGKHIAPPSREGSDFILVPTLKKSEPLLLSLDLIRYAVLFYLSSLVRYSPAALDPIDEGAQAYLMDSVANEVPSRILIDALDGISGKHAYFVPGTYRT